MSTFLKENKLYQEFYEKYESDVTKKIIRMTLEKL